MRSTRSRPAKTNPSGYRIHKPPPSRPRQPPHKQTTLARLARALPNRPLQDTVSTNPQFGCRCNQTAATAAELNRFAPLQLDANEPPLRDTPPTAIQGIEFDSGVVFLVPFASFLCLSPT